MGDDLTARHNDLWREETASHAGDLQDFLSWFDAAASPDESAQSGWWDFTGHILRPPVIKHLGEPFQKTALEIGYGGGRLLLPACHYFRHVIGVDIHQFKERVADLIRQQGRTNFTLYQTDGLTLPVEAESVDFVYSYIVLQHLPLLATLQNYLVEVYRVLKPEAVAILYMGYLEGQFRQSYLDLSSKAVKSRREITLRLTLPLGRRLFKQTGFRIVEMQRASKRPWLDSYGNQFYAIIQK